jgi:hypothetical protein
MPPFFSAFANLIGKLTSRGFQKFRARGEKDLLIEWGLGRACMILSQFSKSNASISQMLTTSTFLRSDGPNVEKT